MDLSTFYFGVSSTQLADANQANGMKDLANQAWTHLSQCTIIFFGIMLLFSIGMAIYYYTKYNKQPGRHYTPKQWGYGGITTLVIVFILTFIIAFAFQKPVKIEGLLMLELKLAFVNTLYVAGGYLVVSFIWCNVPQLPTNAYRFLKI
jgi:heme/copper-type cytochrome/quinol oxidase subunit 2